MLKSFGDLSTDGRPYTLKHRSFLSACKHLFTHIELYMLEFAFSNAGRVAVVSVGSVGVKSCKPNLQASQSELFGWL